MAADVSNRRLVCLQLASAPNWAFRSLQRRGSKVWRTWLATKATGAHKGRVSGDLELKRRWTASEICANGQLFRFPGAKFKLDAKQNNGTRRPMETDETGRGSASSNVPASFSRLMAGGGGQCKASRCLQRSRRIRPRRAATPPRVHLRGAGAAPSVV